MGILAWIVVGLVAGVLASLVMGGTGYGIIGDIVIGIVGAFVGGWLFRSLGISTPFNVQVPLLTNEVFWEAPPVGVVT